MNAILQMVAEYLRSKEFQIDSDDSHITFIMDVSNGTLRIRIDTNPAEQLLTVISVLPVFVPKPRREALAVFLAGVNFGCRLGSIHFNLDSGLVLYCVSVPVVGLAENPGASLDPLVALAVENTNKLLPKLCAQAFGQETINEPAGILIPSDAERDRRRWN